MQCDDLAGKQNSELFPACAVTQAIARARSSSTYSPEQDKVQASHNLEDLQLNLSNTFLGHSSIGTLASASSSENPQVNVVEVNNVLSRQELIRGQ